MGVERGVLIGAAGLRWASWVWLAIVAAANLHRLHHQALALLAVAVTGAVTVAATVPLVRNRWPAGLDRRLVAAEVAAAVFILLADGWVQQGRIVGETLSGEWPIPSILVAALAGGLVAGTAVAVLLAASRTAGALIGGWDAGQAGHAALGAVSTGIEWVAFGVMAAVMIRVLRRAQEQVAEAGARDRIARDLHDGVLQTLTLIERRSPSPEIARLARDQERDLRAYLFGDYRNEDRLGPVLRAAARRLERGWADVTVTVSLGPEADGYAGPEVAAIGGAVAEALTNAAKHGQARTAVVFADVDDAGDGLFVTVKDDGCGFDPAAVEAGVGMAQSIEGRLAAIGGRVQWASVPGSGTEVRMTVPAAVEASPAGRGRT